jgi:phosphoserine phosphatase
MKVVLVDLCGTLVRENTTLGFVSYVCPTGIRSLLCRLARLRPVAVFSTLTGLDLSRRLLLLALRGRTCSELCQAAAGYTAKALARLVNFNVLAEIKRAQSQSCRVLLATASIDPVACEISRALGLSGFVSSTLAYRAGVCTGRLDEDLLGNKWRALVRDHGLRESDEMFLYTDNDDDLDLFARVKRVYFVGSFERSRSVIPPAYWNRVIPIQ